MVHYIFYLSSACIIRFILTYALPDLPVSLYLHRQLRPWSVTTRKNTVIRLVKYLMSIHEKFQKECVIDLVRGREKRNFGGKLLKLFIAEEIVVCKM